MQNYKGLKETVINNYMAIKWKSGRIGQILKNVQSSKTEWGRNRNYEQPNYKHWNWSCDQKSPQKTKAQDQMASHENSIKHLEKS